MSSTPAGIDQSGYVQDVGGGFFYEQFNWRISPNPAAETLFLDFPARGYVDQIVVDTICQGATTPPPPTNVVEKWLQVPDTTPNGLDVKATDPKQLADDFRCTATGPITQVRIWASWLNDLLPPTQPFFSVGIPVVLYNPRSRGRPHNFAIAIEHARNYLAGSTPVAIVRNASMAVAAAGAFCSLQAAGAFSLEKR